jgi:alpha-tubulin suppressor-like RCC1 family protein
MSEEMCYQPTYVEALSGVEPFTRVACGAAHTLAGTQEGDVYGFGWNGHSQVAGGETDCLKPMLCLENQGVVRLSCGFAHSAAISSSGSLFTWGECVCFCSNCKGDCMFIIKFWSLSFSKKV